MALSVIALGCGDSSGPKVKPASIEMIKAPGGPFYAGLPLPVEPEFVVKDQSGNPIAGVKVTVSVVAGGGTIANAPTRSATPSTPIGVWTLGKTPGVNTIKFEVSGLSPVTVDIPSGPGLPAKLIATGATNLTGTVGQPVATPITATLKDAFDNPITNTDVTVAVSGGGTAIDKVTSDNAGVVTVPSWTLGTVKGTQTLTLSAASASLTYSVAAAAGPAVSIAVLSGNNQSGLAGTPLDQPVILAASDQYGNRLDGVAVSFSPMSGGGSLASFTATAAADGAITMPKFTRGRSALPQQVAASVNGKSAFIFASVISDYVIDVRLWGPPMTADQQLLFTNAAARIRGFISGSVPTVDATGADPSLCGVSGVPVLAENVPGVIIYASVQSIDGPGRVLAQASPCYTRDVNDLRTVVGVMEFDVDDLSILGSTGSLQDVITHEMLHVLGFGVFWNDLNLLTGFNTSSVGYTGSGGINGCIMTGGTATCVSSVPVENTGGGGTANSHWRETTFGSELMTGFANSGSMPISIMTVRSMSDLGYTINAAAADPYQIFVGSIQGGGTRITTSGAWEQALPIAPRPIPSRRNQPKR
ncbi:MAG TPA: leishmanolysin-related zinc metalloendopeptidase [Gemmatimonadaceae bacterium]|nr:leishmanolysin-related zinc metalloendopeptidase [Gemmatimonadaceae bacterium]